MRKITTPAEAGTDTGRRGFLKLAIAAAPAAAVTAAGGQAAAATAETETAGSGLRKTAHTKAYWDSARF
ncbi:twin-arginine translocation pathway signal protein [Palleronia sediminis]|uniref:Twin-arginine translocation pathway signal protein n=1 Tax=Palleronia sediminis TaxID=2547833 RepID=A0A4R6A9F3_9RHOB|nr:twin-arginine translocation pathway signal protein [Palleronia sediminis]TDL79515.1 twin-arginine translocation pathway signal protein [Palleronia sediminis]